jgi:hypothetical protein
MSWIDLGQPRPRDEPLHYKTVKWPDGDRFPLPRDAPLPTLSFADIAVHRRTRRSFAEMDESKLASLLLLTSTVIQRGLDRFGFEESFRPAPSAGAIHPIHVIINEYGDAHWHRYDPLARCLVEIRTSIEPATVREDFEHVLPPGHATVLLFAAEPGMTFAKYHNGCSLIWRDGGVLQGYFAAAAEALQLNFSLLGVTGEPWVSRLIGPPALVGVGAAYVGGH